MSRTNFRNTRTQNGYSVVEVLIVVVIVMLVGALALMGTSRAKSRLTLTNNAELLKGHLERVFTDAHKRRAGGASRSIVRVDSPTSYSLTLDFDGDGNVDNRTVALTDNVRFVYDPAAPPTATVDWRGTVAEGDVNFRMQNDRGESVELRLSKSGDTGIDNTVPTMPAITVTAFSGDVQPLAVVNGNTVHVPNPSPSPYPSPLPVCTSGQLPGVHNCRCPAGKVIGSDGKCR